MGNEYPKAPYDGSKCADCDRARVIDPKTGKAEDFYQSPEPLEPVTWTSIGDSGPRPHVVAHEKPICAECYRKAWPKIPAHAGVPCPV